MGMLKGFGAPEVVHVYTRARTLCQEIGDTIQLFDALSGLEAIAFAKSDLRRARDLGHECLALAESLGDSSMLCRASNGIGSVLVHRGELAAAHDHLQRAMALVDKAPDRTSWHHSYARHPLVFAASYDSWALWLLGYPDRARRASDEALAVAAQVGHPHTQLFALHFANVLRYLCRSPEAIRAQADTVIALSSEHGFPLFHALGVIMRGCALAEAGNVDDALAEIRLGLSGRLETGTELGRPFVLSLLAATHARAGQWHEAMGVLTEAIALARERGEHAWEPELLRQQAEALASDSFGDLAGAERLFHQAIACSRGQSALSWELRAATKLARLLIRQGRCDEARDVVRVPYAQFTEGFETPDFLEARGLLESLTA